MPKINSTTVEQWQSVPNEYGEFFEVSSFGRIRRVKSSRFGLKLKPFRKTPPRFAAYPSVQLSNGRTKRKSFYVHILVAEAFIGPRPDGYEVNHKDADTLNPCLENLEYVTPKQNAEHAVWMGRIKRGEAHYRAKLTENAVCNIRSLVRDGVKQSVIADMFGIDASTVSAIMIGKTWKHVV